MLPSKIFRQLPRRLEASYSFLAMISNMVASQSIPEIDNRENKQKLADVAKILKTITDDPEAMNNIELIAQLSSRILFELLNILEPEFEESIKRINNGIIFIVF